MALIIEGGLNIPLPRMAPVRQMFPVSEIKDISAEIKTLFSGNERLKRIKKGDRIAVATGSRGIYAIDRIVRTVVEEIKRAGGNPFIVPAMGSHGGATAEGQAKLLAGYGITEDTMGVPVKSSMDVKKIGEIANGTTVYLDREALASDGIVVINRVKPHTSFNGDYESGLLKMLSIGLGKHRGAAAFHACGLDMFGELLPRMGRVVIENAPVLFGLAILENAYDRPARFEIVWREDLIRREKELLIEAKSLMPKILLDNLQLLIVHEFGKDISGGGMDPNITGRASSPFFRRSDSLKTDRIVVLNLTDASGGNAAGIGVADVVTKKFIDSMDRDITCANAIIAGILSSAKIPVHMPTDREAVQLALKTCSRVKHPESRIVWIKNTLALEKIFASEILLPEIRRHPQLEIIGDPQPMNFDRHGNLIFQ